MWIPSRLAHGLLRRLGAMIKLTRLNHQVVAINPDHIVEAEASPDTTIFLVGGDKLLVRETLDELIAKVIEFRRAIRSQFEAQVGPPEGDPPRLASVGDRRERTSSMPPRGGR